MANDQRTSGFMQQLGLNVPQQMQRTQSRNQVPMPGRGPLTQMMAGAGRGLQALADDDKTTKFGSSFTLGMQEFEDRNIAKDMGITYDSLLAKRQLQQELKGLNLGEGTLEDQIKAATEIAQKASALGVTDVAINAATMKAQLKKQLQQQRDAGIATEASELALAEAQTEAALGMSATVVGREDLGTGKAVRIDEERQKNMGLPPDAVGKMLFIDENGKQHLLDPAEIVPENSLFSKYGTGTIAPRDDNILALARANGATSGNIPKMRGMLTDMQAQAGIITDVSSTLLEMANPAEAFDITGKAAIGANRIITFVDNAANVLHDADNGAGAHEGLGQYEWNGKKVGMAEQHQEFVRRGKDQGYLLSTLNKLSGADSESLIDYLPTGAVAQIRARGGDIALYAEQYWANVMEIAYMDARLREPSNRGLSDKDIENALMRIGAHTANPASFARRQKEMLGRMTSAVNSLGDTIRVPRGSRTSRSDVVDFIYDPQVRTGTLAAIADAITTLDKVVDAVDNPEATLNKFAAVDALMGNPNVTQADVDALTPEEFSELQRRIQTQQGQ